MLDAWAKSVEELCQYCGVRQDQVSVCEYKRPQNIQRQIYQSGKAMYFFSVVGCQQIYAEN